MAINFNELKKNLGADEVYFRPKAFKENTETGTVGTLLLPYVKKQVCLDRLDDVCDPENWRNRYYEVNGSTYCEISIRDGDEWIPKSNNGSESQYDPEKGLATDAFKRAARVWGIGHELDLLPALWVRLKNNEWKRDHNNNLTTTWAFDPDEWNWEIKWDHEGPHGQRGLIRATDGTGQGSQRVEKYIFKNGG